MTALWASVSPIAQAARSRPPAHSQWWHGRSRRHNVEIWIDIEDASGNKYGNGPIKTATGWTSTCRLDAAGTFSFTMPAADPMAAEVQNKRYARCWRAGDDITNPRDHMEEMGVGIIEQISLRVSANGVTMLEVSGIDSLSELGNISVGDLALFTDTVRAPQSVVLIPPEADPPLPTVIWPANGGVIDLDIDPGRYTICTYPTRRNFSNCTLGSAAETHKLLS